MVISINAQIRVSCIGNSITEGSHHGYVEKLDTLLGDSYTVQNDGVSGSFLLRTGPKPYWLVGMFRQIFPFKPQIVTIKLGTNDANLNPWIYTSEFAADLNSMIDTLYGIVPRPQIWLCLPTPYGAQSSSQNKILEGEIIPQIEAVAARRNLPVIDLHTPFLDHPEFFPDGIHPNNECNDSIARIIYRRFLEKPAVQLSDTLLTFVYEFNRTDPLPAQTVKVVNLCPSHVLAPVTVTGQASWLTVGVAGSAPQELTNSVNVQGLSLTEQKYFDTLTVSAPSARTPENKYAVMLWMRPQSAFSYIRSARKELWLTPEGSFTFSACAYNQYDEALVPQPAMTWTATGGSISGTTYTAPRQPGDYQVITSSEGHADTCFIFVSRYGVLPDSGYVPKILLLEKNGCPYFNSLGANISYDYLSGEAAVRPREGDTARFFNQTFVWTSCEKPNGMWLSDSARTFFVSYGMLYVLAPSARQIFVRYRHGDDFSIFANGVRLFKALGSDREAEAACSLSLNPGINAILLKFADKGGYPYFGVRFTDENGRNIRGLNYLLQPDTLAAGASNGPRNMRRPDRLTCEAGFSRTGLRIAITGSSVPYTMTMVGPRGQIIAVRHGKGPAIHTLSRRMLAPGVYAIRVNTSEAALTRIVVVGLQ
jgi:lysophospholipase L1-like esterase